MIAASLLASWLATQQWAWNRNSEPDVAEYRLYWAAPHQVEFMAWDCRAVAHFPVATHCGIANHCGDDATCCGDIPMPTRPLILFVVTAVDTSGNESATEHGPISTCP